MAARTSNKGQSAAKGAAGDEPAGGRMRYHALRDCRIGCFREAGEVFVWERFDPCPAHLEEAGPAGDGEEAAEGGKDRPAPGPTLAEILAAEGL